MGVSARSEITERLALTMMSTYTFMCRQAALLSAKPCAFIVNNRSSTSSAPIPLKAAPEALTGRYAVGGFPIAVRIPVDNSRDSVENADSLLAVSWIRATSLGSTGRVQFPLTLDPVNTDWER